MKLLLIALATTVALPVFAGSLDAPLAEPPVEVSASKPVTPMRNYYSALSVIGGTSAADFTQDDDFPAQNGDLSLRKLLVCPVHSVTTMGTAFVLKWS